MNENNVYRCPYRGKCCAVKYRNDPCVHVAIHKTEPLPRPNSVRTLTYRRCNNRLCPSNGKEYFVENYAEIDDLIRFLITKDRKKIALNILRENLDLVELMRQDTDFIELLNGQRDKN